MGALLKAPGQFDGGTRCGGEPGTGRTGSLSRGPAPVHPQQPREQAQWPLCSESVVSHLRSLHVRWMQLLLPPTPPQMKVLQLFLSMGSGSNTS